MRRAGLLNRSLLVTGGAGFIGSCFVRQACRSEQTQVVNLDKLTYAGNLDSLSDVSELPNYEFVHGDVCEQDALHDLFEKHQPTAVVHFAAESHVDRSIDGPEEFVQTNVVGTVRLLNAALQYWRSLEPTARDQFRFLHVSTDEVFGELGDVGAFMESTPYHPNSPYSASKAASDHFVRAFHTTYGLPAMITNCSNNYGPYQFPEKLIPLMILNAIEGKPLPVYGEGKNVRDWLYVEDHCAALEAVLDRGVAGEVYCIGGDCQRTNLSVVHEICALVDQLCPHLPHVPCASLIQHVADRPGHDHRYAIDASKIKRELGWAPRQLFESGLLHTIRWYIANDEWVERVMSGEYARQRLGLEN